MGANNGTGQPMFFQCSNCRREKGLDGWRREMRGGTRRVELTGKSREANRNRNAGGRNSTKARQYACLDCGHVGWSRHIDLESKERRKAE